MKSWQKMVSILQCECGGDIGINNNLAFCDRCNKKFNSDSTEVFKYTLEDMSKEAIKKNPDNFIARIKYFFKKFPRIYYFLAYIIGGAPVNTTASKFVANLPSESIVTNIGCGTKSIGDNIINIDFFPFPIVDIIAAAEKLPFKDASVDAVVCDNVLEHVKKPQLVVQELYRILKKGGYIYIGVPFIIQYHSSPHDFYRWTTYGIKELLSQFKEVELKIAYGPTVAMVSILSEWLATVLSFNSNILYNILIIIITIVLAPIKLLDFIFFRYKTASKIACAFYFIGQK